MTPVFRTVVPVKPAHFRISHKSTILGIGSCFAETIGSRLETYCFNAAINPTGILFNPASILSLLKRLVKKNPFTQKELFRHQGLWKNLDHHSSFAHVDPDLALEMMNNSFSLAARVFDNLDVLMLTFGTAAVYHHKEQNRVVANCHKMSADTFERKLLSIHEITEGYSTLLSSLIEKKPSLHIIFTVSPVRHQRDNPHENSVSKARLMAAVYELEQRFSKNVYYFPAYEIVMDELRDYRFYEEDMAHPNELAVDYIWGKFREACIAERSLAFIRELEPVIKAGEHRIQNEEIPETLGFQTSLQKKIDDLIKKYPEIIIPVKK